MSKFIDLVRSFQELAVDAVGAILLIERQEGKKEQKMTDSELLRSVAHYVHRPSDYETQQLTVLKNEIERRLIENPSNGLLRPYGEAILALDRYSRDNGHAIKHAFKDLTAPIYATLSTPLERALENN